MYLPILGSHRCRRPFTHMEITTDGGVYLCCSGWQPVEVGNVLATDPVEIWTAPAAAAIRTAVWAGDLRACRQCPRVENSAPPLERIDAASAPEVGRVGLLNLAYDRTCNLSCPSCRRKTVIHNSGPEYDTAVAITQRIRGLLAITDTVVLTGSGDAMASRVYRDLLRSLDPSDFPGLNIRLHTNGILLPSSWYGLGPIVSSIGEIYLSIDAATPDTYAENRRGAIWSELETALHFIATLRDTVKKLVLMFTIQANNWREIPGFIDLAVTSGADGVEFLPLQNWGTFSYWEYAARAVHLPEHADYADFSALAAGLVGRTGLPVDWGGVAPSRQRRGSPQRRKFDVAFRDLGKQAP
jgi:wyosine [tRNA(Phe)-imidazoG37] synthetase (radical SAM superfamily)